MSRPLCRGSRILQRLMLASILVQFSVPVTLGPLAAENENYATVLVYHRFGDPRYPATNTTISQLEAQLSVIRENGYTVWPVSDIVDAVLADQSIPPGVIGITVDDAYLSFYENAWPVFREHDIPVTLFLSSDQIDSNLPDYMSWTQIRALVAEGVTIGDHTASHSHLVDMSGEEIVADLARSRQRLMEELATETDLFAYPYGEYSAAIIETISEAGFRVAFGQHSGTIHNRMSPFELARFSLNEQYGTIERFSDTVLASRPLIVFDVTPGDPYLRTNPPVVGFTVDRSMGSLTRLSCYVSDRSDAAALILLGENRVEVRLGDPLPRGRSRMNCTMPGPMGSWRWFGRQFYVP